MATHTRNVQGHPVALTLAEVDPTEVKLDPANPRVGFSMRQLAAEDRSEAACTLLLTSQEDTEALKRSITHRRGYKSRFMCGPTVAWLKVTVG